LNIEVKADGTTKAILRDTMVTLADGPNSVFHDGGTAIVIHAKEDDYKTDPAGNSGPRIACGVVLSGSVSRIRRTSLSDTNLEDRSMLNRLFDAC
jgi:hypothetical protein